MSDPVLVTDAESRKALAVVRAIGRDRAVRTVSGSRVSIAGWSRWSSHHDVVPNDDAFADRVLDVATRDSVGVIIACQEDTILRLAHRASDFDRAGVTLAFPLLSALEQAFDKARTLDIARRIGLRIPPTRVVEDRRDLEAAASDLGYPVVIKPRHSYYWTSAGISRNGGPRYARNVEDLRAAIRALDPGQPPPLLQSWVPGTGKGIFVLLARDGSLCAAFAHRRIRDLHPSGSASAVRASIAVDGALLEQSVALLRSMGLWGVAMVEFRVDERTGDAHLMEVNARLWGSVQLAVDAGVNFPRHLLDVAEGRVPSVTAYEEGVVVRWWMGDLLGTLRVLRGAPAGFPDRLPRRRDALRDFLLGRPHGMRNEVLRLGDPLPALGELTWAALRRVISR